MKTVSLTPTQTAKKKGRVRRGPSNELGSSERDHMSMPMPPMPPMPPPFLTSPAPIPKAAPAEQEYQDDYYDNECSCVHCLPLLSLRCHSIYVIPLQAGKTCALELYSAEYNS